MNTDVAEHVSLVLLDVFSRAQDSPAQSGGLIRSSVQVIEDNFLQIGLYFLHLSQYHPSLPLYLCLTQSAVLDNVSQDLYSYGQQNTSIPFLHLETYAFLETLSCFIHK